MKQTMLLICCVLVALMLAGCDNTPVVVVATPIPADMGFRTYRHPGGVFSIRLPADWAVRDVSKGSAVRVEFSPSGNTGLPMTVYIINTGSVLDSPSLLEAINKYQETLNGNPALYKEVGRNAQGDGSWRVMGVRQTPIGPRQLNTFFQADKSFLTVIESDITGMSEAGLRTLRTVINSLRVEPGAVVNASQIQADSAVSNATTYSGQLQFASLFTWTNSKGAFIINGEITNRATGPLEAVRVTAILYDAQSNPVAEQANVVPVEILREGATAPFTVQFRTGKPSQAVRYELQAVARNAEYALKTNLGDDSFFKGNDNASYTSGGYLTITGDVVNRTQGAAHFVRATITVYDDQQRVVALDSVFIAKPDLLPGETARFEVTFTEIGGGAYRYAISIEGKGDG